MLLEAAAAALLLTRSCTRTDPTRQSPLTELSQNVLSPARTPLGHTIGLATQQQRVRALPAEWSVFVCLQAEWSLSKLAIMKIAH